MICRAMQTVTFIPADDDLHHRQHRAEDPEAAGPLGPAAAAHLPPALGQHQNTQQGADGNGERKTI